jgi:cell division protein FtsI (penicillin-binding protein 3)
VAVLTPLPGSAGFANYPSYVPDKRQNLTGEQLRNRAMTLTFEPGSNDETGSRSMALQACRVKPTNAGAETGSAWRFQ